MIDPLLSKAIAPGFAVLYSATAWYKLSAPGRIKAVVRDYRLLTTAESLAGSMDSGVTSLQDYVEPHRSEFDESNREQAS